MWTLMYDRGQSCSLSTCEPEVASLYQAMKIRILRLKGKYELEVGN